MPYPWQAEHTFDDGGTLSNAFFTEALASGKGDYPYYFDLAKIPRMPMPFRGSGCFRVNLGASTTDVELNDPTADLALATDDQMVRFVFCLCDDVVMANNDQFTIFNYKSASVTEAAVTITYTTAGGYTIGVGKVTADTTTNTKLTLNEWHHVEVFFKPATGAAGVIEWWLDGQAMTGVTNLTNLAPIEANWGVAAQDAGTTKGTLLFDQVAIEAEGTSGAATRDGPITQRYPETMELTTTQAVFVGCGTIDNISLSDNGDGDAVVDVYDTDIGSQLAPKKLHLAQTAASETVDTATPPVRFTRGCYVVLSGTSPKVIVTLCSASAYTQGGVRTYAEARTPHPMGV